MKRFINLWALLLGIFLILIIFTIPMVYGYIFVVTNPQRALLTIPPLVSMDGVKIGGTVVDISDQLDTRLDKPFPYLSGVGFIGFQQRDNINDQYIFTISFCPGEEIKKYSGSHLNISDEQLPLGIYLNRNNITYTSRWSSVSTYCGGILKGDPVSGPDIQGNLDISYERSLKHLQFSGKLTSMVAPLVNAGNHDDILMIEIDKFVFSIDSPVIYEWSNKAGDTWRL